MATHKTGTQDKPRMCDPKIVKDIISSVKIPVMAKCRVGHFVEAQILEAIGVDFIDESESLVPADKSHYILKDEFQIPFVCGASTLVEALKRIEEGATMLCTKCTTPESRDISTAVSQIRSINVEIERAVSLSASELHHAAKQLDVSYELLKLTAKLRRLPVVIFAAGEIITPADAALCMQLGYDGVFAGYEIFATKDPETLLLAIVRAVKHSGDPRLLAEVSTSLNLAVVA